MKQRHKKRHIGLKLIIFGILIILLIILFDMRIRPVINKISTYQGRIIATRIINQAVYDEINYELFEYEKLIKLEHNSSGEISSVESNMININKLKTQISQQINDALSELDKIDVKVSSGTLSGLHIFYGKGPEIRIQMMPGGFVESKMISSFTSAGINQTLHKIILEINVNITAIIPGYTTSVDVPCNFIIAETVLIGRVPDAYTHVITGSEDVISQINDYQAVLE